YTWTRADRPAALDAQLSAAELDLDALAAFSDAALAGTGFEPPREGALAGGIGKAAPARGGARQGHARLKLDAGGLQIDQLSVGELGGAALDVRGRIDELSSRPRGRITMDLDARVLAGLTTLVTKFAPWAAEPFQRFADRLAPAKVRAVLSIE